MHRSGEGFGDYHLRNVLLERTDGLTPGQGHFRHGISAKLLRLAAGLLHDGGCLLLGLPYDSVGLRLCIRYESLRIAAPFGKPLLIELVGQFLKFVFHAVYVLLFLALHSSSATADTGVTPVLQK